jgi:hypothetical protein
LVPFGSFEKMVRIIIDHLRTRCKNSFTAHPQPRKITAP